MKTFLMLTHVAILIALTFVPSYASNNNPTETSSLVINYTQQPVNLQFVARDNQDSAAVTFAGSILSLGVDSMFVEVYRNNIYLKRKAVKLSYILSVANFSISQKIHSELSEYKFKLYSKVLTVSTLLKTADSVVCGDAYVFSGQSNSHPTSSYATYKNEFCRSFGIQTGNWNGDPYNGADTNWVVSKADGSGGDWAGPGNVGVWGLRLQKLIKETYGIPTCIINGGKAGSTIELNLRNNSNPTDFNSVYGKLLYRVKKSGLNNNIKAIFWYQGESNGTTSWVNYAANFETLYNSWKTDYPNFQKIFLFQTRPCCSEMYASQLRESQRKLPVKFSNIELVSTAGLPFYEGCHYANTGYEVLAAMVFKPLSKFFYSTADTTDMRPPNIRAAYYTNSLKKEIRLLFDNSKIASWPADTLGQSMKNYFYLDGMFGNISTGIISGDTLKLQLINTATATKITYLPTVWTHDDSVVYEGPFMRNSKKVGALSFHDFPISNYAPTTLNLTAIIEGYYNTATAKMNIRDTLTVLLRSNVYPYTLKDSAKAIMDSVSFTGIFKFSNLPTGNYYIAVKGRNCLETWSKNGGVAFTAGSTVSYNFTSSISQAFGNNLKNKVGKFCIYSADVNQDGFVDASDNVNTMNDLLGYLQGNHKTDLNGDRIVDSFDLLIVFNNVLTFISKATP